MLGGVSQDLWARRPQLQGRLLSAAALIIDLIDLLLFLLHGFFFFLSSRFYSNDPSLLPCLRIYLHCIIDDATLEAFEVALETIHVFLCFDGLTIHLASHFVRSSIYS